MGVSVGLQWYRALQNRFYLFPTCCNLYLDTVSKSLKVLFATVNFYLLAGAQI